MKKFTITGKVWRYPGIAGWHFLEMEKEASAALKAYVKECKVKTVAMGYVPIRATVGKTTWETTLFPSKEGVYLLALKAAVRKKEVITAGDRVSVVCVLV